LEPASQELLEDEEGKFAAWKDNDPLPSYLDEITGFGLSSPPDDTMHEVEEKPEDWPSNLPSHPSFGPPSVVTVPKPWGASVVHDVGHKEDVQDCGEQEERRIERPRRNKPEPVHNDAKKRRPVKDRWFYETVPAPTNSNMMPNEKEALITRTATMDDFLDDLPVIESSHVRAPNVGYAGPVECLPGYLEHAADTDESAWDIQGMIFEDKEVG
jgi:hypothetical protein